MHKPLARPCVTLLLVCAVSNRGPDRNASPPTYFTAAIISLYHARAVKSPRGSIPRAATTPGTSFVAKPSAAQEGEPASFLRTADYERRAPRST